MCLKKKLFRRSQFIPIEIKKNLNLSKPNQKEPVMNCCDNLPPPHTIQAPIH